jgi:hypothetical protein
MEDVKQDGKRNKQETKDGFRKVTPAEGSHFSDQFCLPLDTSAVTSWTE